MFIKILNNRPQIVLSKIKVYFENTQVYFRQSQGLITTTDSFILETGNFVLGGRIAIRPDKTKKSRLLKVGFHGPH